MGRAVLASPSRARCSAPATARTASGWPTTRPDSVCSIAASVAVWAAVSFSAGTPLWRDTTAAMCAAVTAGFSGPPGRSAASMRTALHASSSRSSALSGKKRSGRYRAESVTAARTASGAISTP